MPSAFFGVLLIVMIACAAGHAAAQEETSVEFGDNERPDLEHKLPNGLSFEAFVSHDFEAETNLDLDRGDDEDFTSIFNSVEFSFSYAPSAYFDVYVSIEPSRDIVLEDGEGDNDAETGLSLVEANVTFRDIVDGLSVKVGRQLFDDRREWLYDEEFDGARAFFGRGAFGIEASVTRSLLFERDLLGDDNDDHVNNYLLLGRYMPDDDLVLEGYIFATDDRDFDGEQRVLFGLRSHGEIGRVEYWGEAAYVTGYGEPEEAGRNRPDVSGYGFDLGATYAPDAPMRPSVSFGYAYGSGDSDPFDGTDGNFRQTGYQDNNGRFNGIASFKYYGEVFDPELSNLQVFTAGIGLRPFDDVSVDLVYHHYRQNEAVDDIRDSDLDMDPSGDSPDLGDAVDLIFGFAMIEDVSLDVAFGYFRPGKAFPDADDAYRVRVEIDYGF